MVVGIVPVLVAHSAFPRVSWNSNFCKGNYGDMEMSDFIEFPKMGRYSREVIVTEKIDGSNGQIYIAEDGQIKAGSRSKWVTPESDNYGFAKWVDRNKEELMMLGPGRHFGEWWGNGIQRGYGMKEKVFSLFNTTRWMDDTVRPVCCRVVPVLWTGVMEDLNVEGCLNMLRAHGSFAATETGFRNPEGIIIFHVAGNFGLKKTLEKDDIPKTLDTKAV